MDEKKSDDIGEYAYEICTALTQ